MRITNQAETLQIKFDCGTSKFGCIMSVIDKQQTTYLSHVHTEYYRYTTMSNLGLSIMCVQNGTQGIKIYIEHAEKYHRSNISRVSTKRKQKYPYNLHNLLYWYAFPEAMVQVTRFQMDSVN